MSSCDCRWVDEEHRQSGGPRQKCHALPNCELFVNFSPFFLRAAHNSGSGVKAVRTFDGFSQYPLSLWVGYWEKLSREKRSASNMSVTCASWKQYRRGGACPYRQTDQPGGARGHFMAVTYLENSKTARAFLLPRRLTQLDLLDVVEEIPV